VEPLAARKAALRQEILARRDHLDPSSREVWSSHLAAYADTLHRNAPPGTVSGFWPMRSEIDPRPLMHALAKGRRELALPCVSQNGLVFRAYSAGDMLLRQRFGVMEPAETAPSVNPALMLVPLLAFDHRGYRLGYGKGYYDGAIARARKNGPLLAVGVAFACQHIGPLPTDDWDERLDAVLTNTGLIWIGSARTAAVTSGP
jgi:5-formyltetrahydrofolate cyclo-ligase